ncbi:hypothetical protein PF005_g18865 [Phytophthora fragariae]|uniref:Uncharacterized protein n=1 Tax=Phytophthora fragariae TaxID=53985 RepID=A0A6A3SRG2_9STRA|nr:hypothetical protein PF003_g10442 [Phytophthora fragariae]KAE8934969.1 hypothetical protein PF009_g15059 [Phytophthora fragariae]KAE9002276.1 hypothetical protein PF011_g13377 [Phytophthora fragariae]KAE9102650.1 hypothetical protein PF007_g14686 [Phytophthora fragariae]KAE9121967.1 hypothetical protein PF006_g17762 [Phytophthora fragariae]
MESSEPQRVQLSPSEKGAFVSTVHAAALEDGLVRHGIKSPTNSIHKAADSAKTTAVGNVPIFSAEF